MTVKTDEIEKKVKWWWINHSDEPSYRNATYSCEECNLLDYVTKTMEETGRFYVEDFFKEEIAFYVDL